MGQPNNDVLLPMKSMERWNADKPTTEVDGHLYPGLGQTV
jgi:hypothetical protein